MYLILWTIAIIAFLTTGIISITSNFENAFAQKGDLEISPLVEPDKNITIIAIEGYLNKSIAF